MRRAILASVTLFLCLSLVSCGRVSKALSSKSRADEWLRYYEHADDPAFLESELKKKPGNETILGFLMFYYDGKHPDRAKLREFSLQMVKHHPGSHDLNFHTSGTRYRYPKFRKELIAALEAQIPSHPKEAGLHWNLAEICERAAIPPFPKDASQERRAKWFRYHGLPPTTPIPTEIDRAAAAQSEAYYRKAVALAMGDRFYYSFYSRGLAELLAKLSRVEEAIAVYEDAAKSTDPEYAVDSHLSLARIYAERKQYAKAKEHCLIAIRDDNEEDPGKGHVTDEAYTGLGLIALEEGDVKEAERCLLAAANEAEPCCHNTTQGMPLKLAEALIAKGRTEAPREYLRIVLKKFTPHDAGAKALLARVDRMPAKGKATP